MADHDQNSFQPESPALNTTLEPTAPEITHDAPTETTETSASPDLSLNPETSAAAIQNEVIQDQPIETQTNIETRSVEPTTPAEPVAVSVPEISAVAEPTSAAEPEYDAEDFAKALESFDREQAAEK